MNGWVKLHRKLLDNSFLMNDLNAFTVFIKLLLIVNSKGEWSGGRRQLAAILDINDRTLYDVLKRLESHQITNLKSNHKYSVITICNYTKYQSRPNHLTNHNPTTTQPQPNTFIRSKNKELRKDGLNKPYSATSNYKTVDELKQLHGMPND